VTCTKGTGKDIFARYAPDMGYQSGRDVIGSLFPLVYITKVMDRVYTKVQHNTNQISGQNY
jgi:hypothetical protein